MGRAGPRQADDSRLGLIHNELEKAYMQFRMKGVLIFSNINGKPLAFNLVSQ